MRRWTEQQRQAIDARNREVLVSAAAGSGKTSVLIQRVMALLEEGLPLDRMLVVTFTHAAAEEMKSRLTELLSAAAGDSPHLKTQYQLLGRADISTLHSFCQKVVKRHFQAAGTDPLSKLADEALAGELFQAELDAAMDDLYAGPGADGRELIDRFNETEIIGMAGALYRFLMAQDEPWEWLDKALAAQEEGSLYDHPWYGVMRREARLMISGASDLLTACKELCERPDGPGRYLPMVSGDLALLGRLQGLLDAGGRGDYPPLDFVRLTSRKADAQEDPALREEVKSLRGRAKDLVRDALGLLPSGVAQAEEWMRDVRLTLPSLRALASLTRDTHGRYGLAKASRSLWDFSDLEHLALRALKDPVVQREVAGAYDALFVDEYQDISSIQEGIIRRLHGAGNTLFMVGDVKQSIYRFRLADPTLFLRKYRDFQTEDGADARLITLRENFRSRPNILKAVNLVFQSAMRENATEIGYDDQARLASPAGEAESGPPVELWLLEKGEEAEPEADNLPDEEAVEAPEEDEDGDVEALSAKDRGEMEKAFVYEARLIARRVKELLGTPISEGGSTRPLQMRDIAVLLRTASGRAPVMAEILSQAGIPAYSDAEGELYAQQEVRDLLALLKVLDNPMQDTPLLHALACPVFAFSPDDLSRVRRHAPEGDIAFHQAFFSLAETDPDCRGVLDTLARWRFLADIMPLERFIRLLLRESGLYAAAGAKGDGFLRRANLRLLAVRAAPEPEPQTLGGFLRRVLSAMEGRACARSATLGMQENVVRVMTMHKSKGLEFPVVFLPDLAASFSRKRRSLPLRMDAGTGLALEFIDPVARMKREGFGVRAIRVRKNREEISEEARLLYVGMTRARERLILIGAPGNLGSALERWSLPSGDYTAGSALGMLDWVCGPLYPALRGRREGLWEAPGGSVWRFSWLMTGSLPDISARPALIVPEERSDMTPGSGIRDLFAPPPAGIPLPLKSSVTALITGRAGADTEDEETPEVKRRGLPLMKPPAPLPRLTGGGKLTGAQRGAAAHKALCALDPVTFVSLQEVGLGEALALALDGLVARGLLRQEELEALDTAAVEGFYGSELAQRMAASPELHAEWPFTLRVEGGMILQGVLDACFLEDGAWVLVDYKTDWGEPEELLPRYRDQMRWYMRALCEITGMPVKEAWLYLLRGRAAVRVTEGRPIRLRVGDGD